MSRQTWRDIAKDTIAPIEAEFHMRPFEEFKRALYAAYPFGLRQYHPYKVWCEEQRAALARHPESPRHEVEQGGQMTLRCDRHQWPGGEG